MIPCCCSLIPSPASISKFISDQPYLSMLDKNCTSMKDLQKIHAQLIKTGLAKDPIAASRVLAFCTSPAGDINYAYLVFTQIRQPNLFVWNTIIRGFSQSSTPHYAISLFIDMMFTSPTTQPQRLTYPSVFKAYAQLGLAHEGAQLHGRVIKLGLENDQFIQNTILNMYVNCGFLGEAQRIFDGATGFDVVTWNTMIIGLAKCGEIDKSRSLFDKMLLRNTVSWNSMISGYVRKGRFFEAMELFSRMQEEGIKPCEFTMVSLLNACACLGALRQGEWIHDYIVKKNFALNSIVITAIIDMYSKCGSIDKALQVFKSAPKKGLSCWNSLILGLAMSGRGDEAVRLFSMLESSNLKPDHVSFIGVLTACSHAGMVDRAKDYFLLMSETYKIEPSIKHYSCMVDVLGRAGLLEEAEELIRSMPVNPDAIIWGSLLSSCREYGNIEMAKLAAKRVNELDPNESSSFVLLSNVYAAHNHFKEAIEQRISLKEKQMEKEPGCSLIEVNGEIHEFVAGGRLHPRSKDIYHALDDLGLALKEMG
ncbi:PREDICTED: pentatricopeptide repeat-containing protein At2g42920, chloroplastic [Populus euphratica]|uniref:Pentatricopeptide repeat-containing protein At2g42920, chloroplastic n=1 Tax=Populus euphratica TaxID=75702 RepID=A0AAJ6Y7C9_POPEU|nr:PREDICTED: pentatricopeptide repeat-containing protein At2g42920, chloroplastic [Populus euphratica]XP_011044785.1 PREDICTED: pentatricopeptide repeat-containing protein At2g42920, chloroplastic [Populus euphratica]